MAVTLWQRFEYYYYYLIIIIALIKHCLNDGEEDDVRVHVVKVQVVVCV